MSSVSGKRACLPMPSCVRVTLIVSVCMVAAANTRAQSAQSEPVDRPTALAPIVVSGSRFGEPSNQVPAQVQVISRADIADSSAITLVDVLAQLGGVVVTGPNLGDLGMGASVDMGGFGATANSTTLVLVDGLRRNPIDSNGIAWESVPLSIVERIEILHGGASVQYGNGAVGGVINIITKAVWSRDNELGSTIGSNGTLINKALVSKSGSDTNFQLSANTSSSDGWRENSASNAYSFNARLTRSLGAGDELFIDAYASHSRALSPGGVLGQVGSGDARAAKFNNVGSSNSGDFYGVHLGAVRQIADRWAFEGELGYATRSLDYYAPYYNSADSVASGYPGGPSASHIDSWELTFTPRLRAQWGENNQTIVGYDFSRALETYADSYGVLAQQAIVANQGGGYYNNLLSDAQSASVVNHSLYTITRVPLGRGLEASAGARRHWEHAVADDTNISSPNGSIYQKADYSADAFDLALNRQWAGGQRVYLKWNQSFRFANIDEFWGFDPNTYSRIFSGLLRPQVSRTWELGSHWTGGHGQLDAAVFQSTTREEIRYDPNSYFNTNSADPIVRRGLLLQGRLALSTRLSVSAIGKIQRSAYESGPNESKSISLVPDRSASANALYRWTGQWQSGASVRYVGPQYYDGDISNSLAKMPTYTTADVFTGYRASRWDLRLTVRNVTGAHYATYGGYGFVSQPGGGGADSYYYYPSNPRTWLLSGNYRF